MILPTLISSMISRYDITIMVYDDSYDYDDNIVLWIIEDSDAIIRFVIRPFLYSVGLINIKW